MPEENKLLPPYLPKGTYARVILNQAQSETNLALNIRKGKQPFVNVDVVYFVKGEPIHYTHEKWITLREDERELKPERLQRIRGLGKRLQKIFAYLLEI